MLSSSTTAPSLNKPKKIKKLYIMKHKENLDPGKVQVIIKAFIAFMSALLGAISGSVIS